MAPKISRKELLEYKIPKSAVPWSPWPILILILFTTAIFMLLYLYLSNPWFCYDGAVFKNRACLNFHDHYYNALYEFGNIAIILFALLLSVMIVKIYDGKLWQMGVFSRGNKLFVVYLVVIPILAGVAIALGTNPYFFVEIAVIGPFFEEIVFRGLLFPSFAKRIGIRKGIVLTSLVFAVLPGHVQQGFVVVLLIFGFSEIQCMWYLKYKNLWPCILFHSLLNTKALLGIGVHLQTYV